MPDDDAPSPCPIELTCKPTAGSWGELVRTFAAGADPAQRLDQRTMRAELGLPTDRPVVLSGHQPGLWHMGILAKRLALEAAAEQVEGAAGWLIVDHDADDAGSLRVPTPSSQAAGGIEARTLRFAAHDASRPLGLRPASADAGPLRDAASRGLDALTPGRLSAIADALDRHTNADSLAVQLHRAAESILRDALGADQPPHGPASPVVPSFGSLALSKTSLFRGVLEHMRRDPARCRALYNSAVARVGTGAGVRPLSPNELPIWTLRDGRRVATTDDSIGDDRDLVARGLLMTGMLRRAACDLFIHGTGGGGTNTQAGYDAVTDLWLADWLGWRTPAPAVVATATVRLAFPGKPTPPTERELTEARWRAHHAAHSPAMLGDLESESQKQAIIAKIAGSTDRSARGVLYHDLHELLRRVRTSRADRLRALREQAEQTGALVRSSGLRADRTWSFALHPPERVRALREAVRRAFTGGARVPSGMTEGASDA